MCDELNSVVRVLRERWAFRAKAADSDVRFALIADIRARGATFPKRTCRSSAVSRIGTIGRNRFEQTWSATPQDWISASRTSTPWAPAGYRLIADLPILLPPATTRYQPDHMLTVVSMRAENSSKMRDRSARAASCYFPPTTPSLTNPLIFPEAL